MSSLQKRIRSDCRTLAASDRTMEDIYNIIFSHGDRIMTVDASLVGPTSRKTYRQVQAEIETVSRSVSRAMKGEAGQFIGLYGENKPQWIVLFWGILKSGNLPYLINLRQPVEASAEALKSLQAPLTVCVDAAPDLGTEILSYQALLQPASESESSCEGMQPAPEAEVHPPFGDGFALSTSGTTLSKKICIYNGKNVSAQILNVEKILTQNADIIREHKGQIKHLMFLPLYHIFGLEAVLLWYSFFGSTFVFPPDLNPQNLLRTVRDYGVTHVFAVPLLWASVEKSLRKEASKDPKALKKLETGLKISRILQDLFPVLGRATARFLFRDVRETLFGDTLQFCISGGSAIKPSTLELINGMGYHLCNGYGMSEIGITSVDLSKKRKDRVTATIGKPFASVAYRIDCDGRLLVRGSSICHRMTVDGLDCPMGEWFNTGDLMTKNEKGQYLISGRASDLVFGEDGENLNPELAEQALSLPHAKNFTVTGDAKNERLMLIVQISPDLTDEEKRLLSTEIEQGNASLPSAYRMQEIHYTYDPLMAPTDIKISRARLRRQIKDGTVRLFETLTDAALPPRSSEASPIKEELRALFGEILGIDPKAVTDNGHFMHDLGGSSLDYFTLIGRIDEIYGITMEFEMENFSYCLEDFARIIGEKRE
ncbi:MAG: AMP-binding protein [Clostridia bacterium]|nr:AMP-binding protein [Clostridia bacterium]